MASLSEAREEPGNQLWDEIENVHAGMLGLEGMHHHMQPMAPFVDRQTNTIWFYSKADTELVRSLKPGMRAHLCIIGKDHDYYACLSGAIRERKEIAKIEEYWSSIVEAWYDGGKKDPLLTMLALHVDDAEIWAATGNPLRFGWEIAKANLKEHEQPDIGVHRRLAFA